ncbi:MAG: hypothetical protein QHC78_11035 [Pigmentiphaga sp.]|uniref:hypothetical protein n=1 Tax=Pigmentiphaga sp. TaxID=1977564 RepID=UPI0029BD15AE|nr:hypothetical protein [Pigmentiphaga sp.]MDX3906212.1 hypothetical protein [Pigmentiphaga sp.]
MADGVISAHDVFPHIRIVMGMVIGLGVTRLLSGLSRIVQHPRHYPVYPVHIAWVFWLLLMLVHFWWWQFNLYLVPEWTFGKYLFIIVYAIVLFLLCTLLFPDSLEDYDGYEDYFFARRAWFFGLLAVAFCLDIVDTLIKGEAHFARFAHEYMIRTPVFVALCMVGIATRGRRVHILLVAAMLVYQISWIWRMFDTIV